MMSVLIQLTSPRSITAQFNIVTDKRVKNEQDLNVKYYINAGHPVSLVLDEVNIVRERFADPSLLTD